ncbi:HNH endonuclease [Mesorhizobium sp.]|uniref:HNH endonuclease n=1 Tax=Mesorhizobium sp. TaxID=1871066 RepID=UPI00121358DB|nr:HNH endonuclease [Mesorhizobium sp.]TIS85620.1 MAG: HNH endonuclease [Mesorhizobium sp.]
MSWGFERGRVYNRRVDIHALFSGQQQGGIITPAGHNLVIIMTGQAGLDHGYADRWRADGVFEYFGEGQDGPMKMTKGNKAIAEHARNGKDLLLFEKEYPARTLRFRGAMVCEGWHHVQSPDTKGTIRQAIVFELRPFDAIVESVEAQPPVQDDLAMLRARAYAAAAPSTAAGSAVRTIYQRSRDVRDYVLRRAIGKCEGCRNPAPFKSSKSTDKASSTSTTGRFRITGFSIANRVKYASGWIMALNFALPISGWKKPASVRTLLSRSSAAVTGLLEGPSLRLVGRGLLRFLA